MSLKTTTSGQCLSGQFRNPPNHARLLRIIHRLPETEAEQQALIGRLQAQGFGGLAVNAWGEGYLRVADNVRALGDFMQRAAGAGLCLWLYDEWGYPSGTAAGMTLEGHPEWEVKGLLVRSVETTGGVTRIELPPGELVAAFAVPATTHAGEPSTGGRTAVPLCFSLQNRVVDAELPEGSWRVVLISRDRLLEGYQAAQTHGWKVPRPYPDLMNPQAVDRFLEVTHDRYARELGADLGRYFFSTFTDEPSSMAQSFPRRDYGVLPWSPVLSNLLQARYGVSWEDMLPALAADPGPEGQRARYRYFDGVAELMSESFFGRVQERCRAYNVPSGGHLLLEEPLLAHVPLYGDLFRCLRRMDVPGIDVLSSIPANVPWHAARMVSSVAALTGKTYTMSEPSAHVERTTLGQSDPPLAQIRGALNRQLLGGITCFNVYYQFDSLSEDEIRALNATVGRCASALTGGRRKSRVAVLYPIETLWTRWLPEPTAVHSWYAIDGAHPRARLVEETFRRASEALYEHRIEFDYVDSRALIDAQVSSGRLVHGDLAWDVVLLPEVDTLPLAAWQALDAFRESGGTVLGLGATPINSESDFPSAAVEQIADRLSDGGAHLVQWDAQTLVDRVRARIGPGLAVSGATSPLRYTHRVRSEGDEVLLLINDGDASFEETLSLPLNGPVEVWDPMSGEMRALESGQAVQLRFEPYQGLLFVSRARP